mmetsp:Transcript_40908/g.80044  ORF Transcript_40908/g.80044 Transcript_40908/m.80044 type:complete len:331 (-) Transcript_40908:245-1237(-)
MSYIISRILLQRGPLLCRCDHGVSRNGAEQLSGKEPPRPGVGKLIVELFDRGVEQALLPGPRRETFERQKALGVQGMRGEQVGGRIDEHPQDARGEAPRAARQFVEGRDLDRIDPRAEAAGEQVGHVLENFAHVRGREMRRHVEGEAPALVEGRHEVVQPADHRPLRIFRAGDLVHVRQPQPPRGVPVVVPLGHPEPRRDPPGRRGGAHRRVRGACARPPPPKVEAEALHAEVTADEDEGGRRGVLRVGGGEADGVEGDAQEGAGVAGGLAGEGHGERRQVPEVRVVVEDRLQDGIRQDHQTDCADTALGRGRLVRRFELDTHSNQCCHG